MSQSYLLIIIIIIIVIIIIIIIIIILLLLLFHVRSVDSRLFAPDLGLSIFSEA